MTCSLLQLCCHNVICLVYTGGGGREAAHHIKVTKCVVIRAADTECPTDCQLGEWMKCSSVASPTTRALCTTSAWELADTSHVLLHIDVPNQQLYHLPLLITPVQCVYLITFNLRPENEKESLGRIHNAMKNVYALTSYHTEGSDRPTPQVLLVGMHADKVEAESRKQFGEKLQEMLAKMPYNKLVCKPRGSELFWAVEGGDLSIGGSDALSNKIKSFCSRHQSEVHQWMKCHCELKTSLKDVPCISYPDLKNEVACIVSNLASLRFSDFLKFLHNYGFVFYRSEKEDELVLLQPQHLCKIFADLPKLSEDKEQFTIADLFACTEATIEASAEYKQWFRRICIDLGLVFEVVKEKHSEFVFVMGLKSGPPSCPPLEMYSVPPLLVTFKASDYVPKEEECLLPSHFFAALVTEFLRTQHKHKKKDQKISVLSLEQHYMQVKAGGGFIHVVEREFCIEIGIQQVDLPRCKLSNEAKIDKLQSFCSSIKGAVDESTDSILARLKLSQSSLCYGFYHSADKRDSFVEYVPGDEDDDSYLQCRCCKPPERDVTPLQSIWFDENIVNKVRVELWMPTVTLCIQFMLSNYV